MTTIIPPLPRRSESGMPTRAINTAAGVLQAAMQQGQQTPTGLALALDAARLLNSPETAAEFEKLLRWHREDGEAITKLVARIEQRRARLVKAEADLLEMRGLLSPNGEPRRIPAEVEIHERVAPAVEWLLNRVAELETRLADEGPIAYTLTEQADGITQLVAPVQALREDEPEITRLRDQLAALTKAAVEGRAALASFCYDLEGPGTAALGALYLLQQATTGTPMQPGETVPKVYRASHDSIVMGLYTTATEARKHCETKERCSWPKSEDLNLDWIEDEEDGVAEMTVFVGGEECTTGYVVTALEVATAYDEEADQ
ncbi:hypothetical protein ACFWOL_15480 [Streptomyces sp. NPDC058442]|uniref:hypothetical protein n=1 Tax=Streptomyces sp. NPDC058442 TaxID=3346503 RepID=UPI0036680728